MIEAKQINNKGLKKIESIKSDYYYIPVVDGKEYNHCAETPDVALLLGLQIKYDGLNSQFCKNACRMLRIESAWAL